MNDWHGIEHMSGMWIWWILGVAIIAALAWAVVKPLSRPGGKGDGSAEEVLKRRYARGEIEKEEYEKRLHDLRQ